MARRRDSTTTGQAGGRACFGGADRTDNGRTDGRVTIGASGRARTVGSVGRSVGRLGGLGRTPVLASQGNGDGSTSVARQALRIGRRREIAMAMDDEPRRSCSSGPVSRQCVDRFGANELRVGRRRGRSRESVSGSPSTRTQSFSARARVRYLRLHTFAWGMGVGLRRCGICVRRNVGWPGRRGWRGVRYSRPFNNPQRSGGPVCRRLIISNVVRVGCAGATLGIRHSDGKATYATEARDYIADHQTRQRRRSGPW